MLHVALALCTLSLAFAPAARAQPRIVVVRASEPTLREPVAVEVVAALTRHGIAARVPPAPEPTADELPALEAAERAYHTLRPEEAAPALEAILERVEARGGGLDRDALLRALLVLAMARAALGDGAGADAAVDRALTIDPALAPDPARYPPTLRERIEARRREPVLAELSVRADPPEAAISIDGLPGAIRAVVPGRHLVSAAAPRRRAEARAVDVPETGVRLELALAIDPAGALALPGAPGSPIPPELGEAARLLGASLLVIDATRDQGVLRLQAQDGARRVGARGAEIRATSEAIAAALATETSGGVDPIPWIAAGTATAVALVVAIAVGIAVSSQAPSSFAAHGTVVPP